MPLLRTCALYTPGAPLAIGGVVDMLGGRGTRRKGAATAVAATTAAANAAVEGAMTQPGDYRVASEAGVGLATGSVLSLSVRSLTLR